MGLFKFDSPLMRLLSKVADLVIVNFLVLICSLPIFTVGASLTAMQSIFYRLLHNEDVYVFREFFASFRKNFKQATIIWIILLPVIAFLVYDYYMLGEMETGTGMFLSTVSLVLLVIIFVITLYLFPILSRYDNSIKETFKNAIVIAISHPVRSVIMAVIFGFCIFIEIKMPFNFIPLTVAFCISLPWYLCSMVYMPIFDKLDGIEPGKSRIEEEE